MLQHFFHHSPGVFCTVNFALFNEDILLLSAEPLAPVSCWRCLSPQFTPGALGVREVPWSAVGRQKGCSLCWNLLGMGVQVFQSYLLLLQAHELNEHWS